MKPLIILALMAIKPAHFCNCLINMPIVYGFSAVLTVALTANNRLPMPPCQTTGRNEKEDDVQGERETKRNTEN